MEPNNYTIKEFIEHQFKETNLKMDMMHEDIKETKIQAQKTNGRVNRHDWYFKAIWWALGAAWTLILIGIPVAYRLLKYDQEVQINNSVNSALQNKLEQYEFIYLPDLVNAIKNVKEK